MVNLSNKITNNRKLVSFRDQESKKLINITDSNFLCDNEVYSILKNNNTETVTSLGGVAGKPSFQVMHQRLGRPQSATPTLRTRSQSVLQKEDLCFACFDRGDKNENANWTREKSARSRAEERTLQHYHLFRHKVAQDEQEAREELRRNIDRLNASFNMGMAQAQKYKQSQKPPFTKMFLFQKRPHTAQVYMGVGDKYGRDLRQQIREEQSRKQGDDEEKFRMDWKQQQRLRNQLSAQRRRQKKQNIENKAQMKDSLDHQVLTKIPPLPLAPARPAAIFCQDEESLSSKRRKAKKLANEQLDLAIMKKQNELIEELMSEYEQKNAICRSKTQLREENLRKQLQRMKVKNHLDTEWQHQMMIKQSREQAEVYHLLRPGGACLMEQCSEYARCGQCHKRINNRGKSNIFKDESAYTAGTRFMI